MVLLSKGDLLTATDQAAARRYVGVTPIASCPRTCRVPGEFAPVLELDAFFKDVLASRSEHAEALRRASVEAKVRRSLNQS